MIARITHIYILVGSLLFFNVLTAHAEQKKQNYYNSESVYSFSKRVFLELCESGVKYPNVVMRQAILETGWFKSKYLMSRNNLFGFKSNKYLRFNKWQDSVVYYKTWQDRKYDDTKYGDYYSFLTTIKYGSPDYLSHLKKIKWEQECMGQ